LYDGRDDLFKVIKSIFRTTQQQRKSYLQVNRNKLSPCKTERILETTGRIIWKRLFDVHYLLNVADIKVSVN